MPQTIAATLTPVLSTPTKAQIVQLGTRAARWVRIRNESAYQLDVDTFDGSTHELGAQEIMVFPLTKPTEQIALTARNLAPTPAGSAPANYLSFMYYLPQDGPPVGQYPVSILRQAAVSGGVTVTNATTLQNDTSPVGTQFIEGQPLPNPFPGASFVRVNTDGSMEIQLNSFGALRNFLSAVAGATFTHAVLTIGDSNDVGMLTLYGALHGNADTATALTDAGGDQITMDGVGSPTTVYRFRTPQPAGVISTLAGLTWDGAAAHARTILDQNGKLSADSVTTHLASAFSSLKVYTGTGPTTVTHGLGGTPTGVFVTPTSAPGATIPEASAIGATTFVVTVAAGVTWIALAFL